MRYVYGCLFLVLTSISCQNKQRVESKEKVSTIDSTLQIKVTEILKDKMEEVNALSGQVIIMETKTGEIKAMVGIENTDTFNYGKGENIFTYRKESSLMPVVSLLAALESGKATFTEQFDTSKGNPLLSEKPFGNGLLTISEGIKANSSLLTAKVIEQVYGDDPNAFYAQLNKMSYGKPYQLDSMPNLKSITIVTPEHEIWESSVLPLASLGFYQRIAPIQMLTFYNAIANNGVMIRPKFVKAAVKDGEVIEEYPTEVINPKICSDRTLTQIRDILEKVVSQGLAKPAGSKQFSVAGKTGTAQVSQGTAGYKNGRVNYLVSFCGYFPADAPKYSCIVSIQKPGLPASGGLMAGSVFGKIAERVYAKNLRFDIRSAIDSTSNVIPPVKAGEMNEAFQVLNSLKVPVQKQFTSKKGQEVWGHTQAAPNAVVLQGKDGANPDLVPSVIGMGAKDAVYLLESKGLKVRLNGIGKVRNQSIPGGNRVVKGQTVTLALH